MRMLNVVQCSMMDRNHQCSADQIENVNLSVMELRNKGLSVCLFVISDINYSIALSSFSTTTDKVYNNIMRSHDTSEADFLAVEATVLNVSFAASSL